MKLISHPRMPFCAPEGKVIIEADYSAMELCCGAAASKDPVMTEASVAPKKLLDIAGKEYDNPYADMHTMTAKECINPPWFEGIPETQWVEQARKKPPGEKYKPRELGKTLNFANIFLSTAASIAERNNITLEMATEWNKRHKETYKGYYDWAAEVGRIAVSRGYAYTECHRWRYVDEANSKGSGESTERNAVNFLIQGYCSDITKEADIQLGSLFKGTDIYCLLAVHDALVFEAPGSAVINWDESKCVDGVWTELEFIVNDEAEEIAAQIIKVMQDVETEMFSRLGSPIQGAAEAGISLYWNH